MGSDEENDVKPDQTGPIPCVVQNNYIHVLNEVVYKRIFYALKMWLYSQKKNVAMRPAGIKMFKSII